MTEPIEEKPERRKQSKFVTHYRENKKQWTIGMILAGIVTFTTSFMAAEKFIDYKVQKSECVTKIEKDFAVHVENNNGFEKRLDKMDIKLDRILERLPRR
jgi:uncharacterized protein YjcR